MTFSSLVTYTRISPNYSSRNGKTVDTVSIHCMAGNLSVETCGNLFANPARQASSNYGIETSGRIGGYVPEEYRSWCTSSRSNDERAITIEVANTVAAAPWPVSTEAFNSLINLLSDICKRHNIKKLLWQGDKSLIGQIDLQNMTVHRWFAAKACPGDYLYNRHGEIASLVNKRLEEEDMDEARVRQIAADVIREQNPLYKDITDVPSYWRPSVQKLLDAGVLNGGTPESVNATDVNLTMDTIKGIVLMEAYYGAILGVGSDK